MAFVKLVVMQWLLPVTQLLDSHLEQVIKNIVWYECRLKLLKITVTAGAGVPGKNFLLSSEKTFHKIFLNLNISGYNCL